MLQFGPFQLDVAAGELRRDGQPTRLQPQPVKVLALLATQAGRLVTRDEIRAQIWKGDTFVDFEQGLNYCIAQIRAALGDDAKEPRYVETLQRRGYRFVAPVERRGASDAPSKTIIAVLPFENLSGDPDQEFFSDGLTDEMITQLGRLNPDRLGVIARTSAMQYKATRKTARDIGCELGAGLLLEGSVRRADVRVRVTAKLVQAADQTTIWGQTYDRELGDILRLQGDVARAIADGISLQLTPRAERHLARAPSVHPDAYDNYLKARFFWNQRTRVALERAIELFERAIAIEPTFALAHAGVGDCYLMLGSQLWIPPTRATAEANAALDRALTLDDSHAEPYAALGFIRSQYEYRWQDAHAAFRRALDLNANYATAHHWFAFYLAAVGRLEEAIAEIETSERLDPLSPIISTNVGTVLFWARRFDSAIDQYREVLRREPNFWIAHWMLGLAYEQLGHYDAAISEHRSAIERSNGVAPVLPPSLARALALSGAREEAASILAGQSAEPSPSFFHIAAAHAALRDADAACAWLRRSVDQGESWAAFLNVDARLDTLRGDPRFTELVRLVHLA